MYLHLVSLGNMLLCLKAVNKSLLLRFSFEGYIILQITLTMLLAFGESNLDI